MGWDVLIFKLKDPTTRAKDLAESDVLNLGEAPAVRGQIDAVIPGVSWADPEWGYVYMLGSHLEFNMKEWNGLHMGIHVHGAGDPVTPIVALCRAHGWVAFDTTAGDFIDLNAPSSAGWKEFQAFRDEAIKKLLPGVPVERQN
jgi:hypothetical protein